MTAEALLDLIERDDAHPALLVPGNAATVSYSELHAAVDRVARSLAAVGIEPGDAVALCLPNGPEIVIAFLAIVAAGAGAAPLNPAYTPRSSAPTSTISPAPRWCCTPGRRAGARGLRARHPSPRATAGAG